MILISSRQSSILCEYLSKHADKQEPPTEDNNNNKDDDDDDDKP